MEPRKHHIDQLNQAASTSSPATSGNKRKATDDRPVPETLEGSFTPQLMNVNHGEDVVSSIVSSFKLGITSVCVLSATGAASEMVISSKFGPFKRTFRILGHFQIISLSGSFLYITTPSGQCRRQNITLTGLFCSEDGNRIGGPLDSLKADGTIQLVLGTFQQDLTNKLARSSSAPAAADASGPSMPRGGKQGLDLNEEAEENQGLDLNEAAEEKGSNKE